MSMNRREFLGVGIAAAAVVPGLNLVELAMARAPDQAVTALHRWGLLVDATQCVDSCNACVTACHDHNGVTGVGNPATDAQWIRKVTLKNKLTGHVTNLPLMCVHCEEPPCVDVCPTGASFRRDDGIVLVDRHICIGCRYCMMACPYKARSFVHEPHDDQVWNNPRGKGCVESCNLCVDKIDNGDNNTACAEACQQEGHQAILFGDLNDPNSELSRRLASQPTREIRADLDLNTGVRFAGI